MESLHIWLFQFVCNRILAIKMSNTLLPIECSQEMNYLPLRCWYKTCYFVVQVHMDMHNGVSIQKVGYI